MLITKTTKFNSLIRGNEELYLTKRDKFHFGRHAQTRKDPNWLLSQLGSFLGKNKLIWSLTYRLACAERENRACPSVDKSKVTPPVFALK